MKIVMMMVMLMTTKIIKLMVMVVVMMIVMLMLMIMIIIIIIIIIISLKGVVLLNIFDSLLTAPHISVSNTQTHFVEVPYVNEPRVTRQNGLLVQTDSSTVKF